MTDGNKSTIWTAIKPFLNGGASGMMATCVIQPIDMVKVRLQLGAQGSPVGFLKSLIPDLHTLAVGYAWISDWSLQYW